jgi:hypothetical protein
MAKYYGSQCLTPGCDGHKTGARYTRGGGRTLTRSSPSFNNGMRIAQKQLKNKGTRTRLSVTKKSK